MKIVITGAAGLVGQNLIARLKQRGGYSIVGIDKHAANLRVLRQLHPDISVIEADMAETGPWTHALADADSIVVAHAQIGGLDRDEFIRNNVTATQNMLDACAGRHLVHISSSVLNSRAVDFYTETKKAQEEIVVHAGNPAVILRPTLMFGWFDRKHLGWLARFMKKAPVFPVPGSGQFLRQPLYAGDFCDIIIACLEQRTSGAAYNISGREHVAYIDMIRLLREASGGTAAIVGIPVNLFRLLLAAYARVDRNPPFTTKQLDALMVPETFEIIDWPAIFGVRGTSLRDAMMETFRDPRYGKVMLEF